MWLDLLNTEICDYRLTALPRSVSIMSSIDKNLMIVFFILRKRDLSQKMEPATGGWFLKSGGEFLPSWNNMSILFT